MSAVDPWLKRVVYSRPFEYAMGLMAVVVVTLYLSEFYYREPGWKQMVINIEHTVIIVFAFEYFVKFYYARDKWQFVRTHIIELLSIIPFSLFFQSLRLIRFIRILLLLRFAFVHLEKVLKRNVLLYATFLTFSIVIVAAFGVYHFEQRVPNPNMSSIGDALWWSWVTTTTVGYGDIIPNTTEGRIIAAVLMLVGISFLGVLTGTIASYFIRTLESHESVHNATLQMIIHKIRQIDKLKREDIDEIADLLLHIWEREQAKKRRRGEDV